MSSLSSFCFYNLFFFCFVESAWIHRFEHKECLFTFEVFWMAFIALQSLLNCFFLFPIYLCVSKNRLDEIQFRISDWWWLEIFMSKILLVKCHIYWDMNKRRKKIVFFQMKFCIAVNTWINKKNSHLQFWRFLFSS